MDEHYVPKLAGNVPPSGPSYTPPSGPSERQLLDDLWPPRLSANPPNLPSGPSNGQNGIRVQPHPFPIVSEPNHGPNIFLQYPAPPPPPPQSQPAGPPPNAPTGSVSGEPRSESPRTIKIGPWRISKPHPLLWLCLALSVLALVLEVPKGSLPTLTGRHKALRTREKILQDRLNLINQLSIFLPPPLSSMIQPPNQAISTSGGLNPLLLEDQQLRLIPGLRFWNTQSGFAHGLGVAGEDGKWWSVEDLGAGASVVRSKHEGEEKEVWVLRVGEGEAEDKTLLHALTHSLLLRDKLQSDNAQLRATPCPATPCPPAQVPQQAQWGSASQSNSHGNAHAHFHESESDDQRKEEWERLEERRKREREREREVEEREREVGRREKWVVDEMRKLSDKVHSQASELTLEDRITERLKAYQRQLAQVNEHDEL